MADRAAHEIRNPLNGLAVNLEVVRSRAARAGGGGGGAGGGDLASVGRFAESAAGELERAAELVQALLELARPMTGPVDLWSAWRPMVALHNAVAVAAANGVEREGSDAVTASVALVPRGDTPLIVTTDSIVARVALASALDAAARARIPARVECSVKAREEGDGGGVEGRRGQVVAMLRCTGPVPPLDGPVRDTIERGGVMLEMVPNGMMLFFRAAGRD